MTSPQKTIITITSIMLGLIIILAVFIAWQKNKLVIRPFTNLQPEQTEETKEPETITQETKIELTAKQQIVKDIAPESDLSEFDIPDVYLDKDIIINKAISPAFNRTGKILKLIPAKNQFLFLNNSLDKDKEYTVQVDNDTVVSIYTIEDIYQNENSYEPIEFKNYSTTGNFQNLAENDSIDIRAREMINQNYFIAENIRVTRNITTFLE